MTGRGKVTSFPHCVLFSYPQLSTCMQSSRLLSMSKRQASPLSCSVEAKNACDCPNLFSNFSWGTRIAFSLPISYEVWELVSINALENIITKEKGKREKRKEQQKQLTSYFQSMYFLSCIPAFHFLLVFLLFLSFQTFSFWSAAQAACHWPAVARFARRLCCSWGIISIQSMSSENTTCPDIYWSLDPIKTFHVNLYRKVEGNMFRISAYLSPGKVMMNSCHTYIKKHNIVVWISVVLINAIKSLWKLNITIFFSQNWVHQKTHCLP